MLNYHWQGDRRFNSWTTYTKKKYGVRLQKVSLNAGFTCPNRDGTIAHDGCIYCNNKGFSPSYCDSTKPIKEQLDEGIVFLKKRYKKNIKFIAYFQAFTNTYDSIEKLEEKYWEALSHKDIVGISIGTRPDCINDQILDLLEKISETHFVFLEIGAESCYDETLKRINRGHTFDQTKQAINLASKRGLHITTHFIFGLPGESHVQMLKQAGIISAMPVNSIKFHQLQIVKDTKMAEEYLSSPEKFDLFGLQEYIDFIISFTERLAPWIIIERFCGEVPLRLNAGRHWGNIRYEQILKKIEENFEKKNTWQGKFYNYRGLQKQNNEI